MAMQRFDLRFRAWEIFVLTALPIYFNILKNAYKLVMKSFSKKKNGKRPHPSKNCSFLFQNMGREITKRLWSKQFHYITNFCGYDGTIELFFRNPSCYNVFPFIWNRTRNALEAKCAFIKWKTFYFVILF